MYALSVCKDLFPFQSCNLRGTPKYTALQKQIFLFVLLAGVPIELTDGEHGREWRTVPRQPTRLRRRATANRDHTL